MKDCCIRTGEQYFATRFPLAGPPEEELVLRRLIDVCKKWGPLATSLVEGVYIRTTSSPSIGVNAETAVLRCNECGDAVRYAFLGSRFLSFIWRVNMVAASFWAIEPSTPGYSMLGPGTEDWPREEHLEQLRIAFDMYFGDFPLLRTEGLTALNQQISSTSSGPLAVHVLLVDFAELFILFHEIQHQMPLQDLGDGSLGVRVEISKEFDVSEQRATWWKQEVDADANALFLLILSAGSYFHEHFGLTREDARAEAASLACAGADAALHTLQLLEERLFGKVELQNVATDIAFATHPPSRLRRDTLSRLAYSLVTGKKTEDLYRRDFTPAWTKVAQNVASHMKVRDLLFERYKTWAKRNDEKEVAHARD